MSVYAIKSSRGYLVALSCGRAAWASEVRDDVWQFTTRKAAEALLAQERARCHIHGARVVRVNVEERRPVKASIRGRQSPKVYRIWQNTTVADMRRALVALDYEVISITPCEHGPRGYRYVHELEDWDY
jgi:hypothetical protein